MLSNSLCTTLCLQWEPEVVAIAMIFLACKLRVKPNNESTSAVIPDWEGRLPHHKNWWDVYVEDLGIDILEDICHQVLDLYQPPSEDEDDEEDTSPKSPTIQPKHTNQPPPPSQRNGYTHPESPSYADPMSPFAVASGQPPPPPPLPVMANSASLPPSHPYGTNQMIAEMAAAAAAASFHHAYPQGFNSYGYGVGGEYIRCYLNDAELTFPSPHFQTLIKCLLGNPIGFI